MEIIKGILKAIDILFIIYMLYYVVICILAYTRTKNITKHYPRTKFAVLIPARNEENVIACLIDSLEKQNYPKELYDIFVIPNNCIDSTEEIARAEDTNIINISIPVRSKGDVLKYTFKYLQDENYDAYVIFDADNIVHPDFLNRMNDSILNGYRVAQGFRDTKNAQDSWISNCYAIHYWMQNLFLNKVRMNLNLSSFINGTGVMITKDFIEENKYEVNTVTEDIELSAQCALNNEKVAFIHDAITYDEQVTTLKESIRQRLRWSIGTVQCLNIYGEKLFKAKSFIGNDMLLFLLAIVIQLLGTMSYIMHFLLAVFTKLPINLTNRVLSILIGYLASIILSIITLKLTNKNILKNIKGILTFPIFIFTWIPINVIALFKKKCNWKQIKHTKCINIDDMLNLRGSILK